MKVRSASFRYSTDHVKVLSRGSQGRQYPINHCRQHQLNAHDIHTCIDAIHSEDLYRYLAVGSTAGGLRALSRGITFPLDTIKTLAQAKITNNRTCVSMDILRDDDKNVMATPSDNLNVKSYFRGVVPSVLSAIPANALFFLVYNTLDNFATCYFGGTSFLSDEDILFQRLLISAVATLPQNFVKVPFELLKQRAQTSPELTYVDIYKQIVNDIGFRGLFRGGGAQLIREIPYNSFQMSSYAYLMDRAREIFAVGLPMNLSTTSPIFAGFLGLIAAGFAALLTQPADVIKTKMMTNMISNSELSSSRKFRNPFANLIYCISNVYEKDGLDGFFIGLKERLLIVTFGGMIYFWGSQYANNLFLAGDK